MAASTAARLRRIGRLEDRLALRDDLRLSRACRLVLRPGLAAEMGRVRLPGEADSVVVRRLIADDLRRCPAGDLRDRALLLFARPRERGPAGRAINCYTTEEMADVLAARAYALGLARQEYVRALLHRADILRGHGIAIPPDPEDAERAAWSERSPGWT
jgi:hypothetical protein